MSIFQDRVSQLEELCDQYYQDDKSKRRTMRVLELIKKRIDERESEIDLCNICRFLTKLNCDNDPVQDKIRILLREIGASRAYAGIEVIDDSSSRDIEFIFRRAVNSKLEKPVLTVTWSA